MQGRKLHFFVLFLVGSLLLSFSGCEVSKQTRRASNLANCDFRIISVDDINLNGVRLQNIQSVNDLNFSDIAMLMAGLTSPVLPLSLTLNLEGRNPNSREAGLNRVDWILFIDDNQMTSGILDQPITIPAKGSSTITVQVGMDLKPVLTGKSADAILNFCMNLAGVGNVPTRFKIKMKPTITVGSTRLKYPGYITVNTTYQSQ